ncbi:MAG: hypothetical protein KY412_04880 [Actinobacteria bacterium]|nr:hypothetical protein [Actinomycetota bacterium]
MSMNLPTGYEISNATLDLYVSYLLGIGFTVHVLRREGTSIVLIGPPGPPPGTDPTVHWYAASSQTERTHRR